MSWVRTQPTELATTQSAASHLAARSRPGTAGRRSTATPGNRCLTSALRRAIRPASRAASTADRFAEDICGGWLRYAHRCDASFGNLTDILAAGSRGRSEEHTSEI